MAYVKAKARNKGFHARREQRRAAVGTVQRVLTKVAGYTLVTVKRKAGAFRHIAEAYFPQGLENVRERRPGILRCPPGARSTREPSKLRANYAGRMAEVG